MTAPNIPANGGPGDSAKILDMDDAAFAASLGLEKTGPTAVEAPATPATEGPARGPDGKFVAKEAAAETAKEETPVVAEKTETETVAEETPETTTEAEKPVEPVKAPLTKFQAVDAEGKPVELPNAILKYKVDGKIVENDLTKTVHLAQQATYNARQVQDLTERNTAGDAQLREALATVAKYEESIAAMFADESDGLYGRAKLLHRQNNSPEQVAAAAKAEAAQIRNTWQQEQEQAAVAQIVTGTIQPALLELVKEYPTVSLDDLAGQIALASIPFQVNGRVPLTNMPKMTHWVNTDLAEWAEAAHTRRTEASRTASKSLDKERANTQAKQKEIARALAPVGGVAGTAPKPTPITRASDVLNDPMFGGPQ